MNAPTDHIPLALSCRRHWHNNRYKIILALWADDAGLGRAVALEHHPLVGDDVEHINQVADVERNLQLLAFDGRIEIALVVAAFGALANAARASEDAARKVLDKARQALVLPDKRYPKEELVGMIGRVIHAWPALRGPREMPVIYRRSPAA